MGFDKTFNFTVRLLKKDCQRKFLVHFTYGLNGLRNFLPPWGKRLNTAAPKSDPVSHLTTRGLVLFVFAAAILATLIKFTQFKTDFEIVSDPTGITLFVDGQKIQHSFRVGDLKSISITACQSYFPIGCQSLELIPNGKSPVLLDAPKRFSVPSDRPMSADWWIDTSAPSSEQFRQAVDVKGSFRMKGTFTGRHLGNIILFLEGENNVQVIFRTGMLNNDFGFIFPGEQTFANPMDSNLFRDFKFFIHPLLTALLVALLLKAGFGLAGSFFQTQHSLWTKALPWTLMTRFVLGMSSLFLLWVCLSIFGTRPHFQDELGYLLRAKWLLAGHFTLKVPQHPEHFAIPFTYFIKDKWMVQYPLGWSSLLLIGQAFKSPWLVAPVCSLVLAFTTWKLGNRCGGGFVGFTAVVFSVTSPLMILLSTSMMAHTATAMWLALFLLFYIRGWDKEEHRIPTLALAGLMLGFAFSTRPLSALAMGFPAGIYALVQMRKQGFTSKRFRAMAALVSGGLAGTVPQLIDNWIVTGNPVLFAQTLCRSDSWAFMNYHEGLFWADHTFALTPTFAFGWGWPLSIETTALYGMALSFVFIPFILRSARATDWLLAGVCVALPVAYMGANGGTSLHGFGPRFYADVFFALFILCARGFQVLALTGNIQKTMVAFLLVLFCGSTAIGLPKRLEMYRGYNDVSNELDLQLKKNGIREGLILLSDPVHINWIIAAPHLPVGTDGKLVFAEKLEDNSALIKSYPDKPVYTFRREKLRPYEEAATEAPVPEKENNTGSP